MRDRDRAAQTIWDRQLRINPHQLVDGCHEISWRHGMAGRPRGDAVGCSVRWEKLDPGGGCR